MGIWVCSACRSENPEGTGFCGHCGAAQAAEVSEEHLRGVISGRIGERLAEGGREMPQERRLITALFADVSGFTALADRLEPEELLEVIDPVIGRLSSVVTQYEGYIEKFAGDALLALFGAPVAHEDDAERALLAGLEMHRELARMVDEDLPPGSGLTLHVGVNSGHGIGRILGSEARTDYAVLGDSVILAQRLESAAPRRATYVSQLTYELTNYRFEFEPVGELTLKGKAQPVFAWRLIGERSRTGRRGAPERPATRLVGREDELSALSTVLDGVVAGGGGTVTVTGDAGIGKSRLTEEARERSTERGIQWLEARCLSYGAALPYWPYADLLRRVVGIAEGAADASTRLDATFASSPWLIPYFSRLLGLPTRDGDGDVMQLEPEEFRRRLHESFKEWLVRIASDQPTVLSLEDLHWADNSTLELTTELVRVARGAQLVIYLIGRPETKQALRRVAPDAVRIELGPLGDAQVDAVIKSSLEGSPPRQLARVVQHHTGGNPFFVQELVRSLQETGDLVRHKDVWRLRPGWEPSDLPPTLEGVLAARIDLLPLSAANALHIASVVGRRLPLRLLRSVATDLPELDDSLEQLVAAGLLDPVRERDEDAFVFHHALVQDVAYGQLLRRPRRELHLRVAEAAESLYGSGDDTIDLLARHLYLGDAGERAVPYLVHAGERAKALFANDDAIAHFAHAAEITPGEPGLELRLADLHELVGNYDEALRRYEAVREGKQDIRTWHGIAATLRKRGEYLDALATVDDAFGTLELKGKDLTPLWLEAGWTLSLTGRYAQAIDVLRAGLEAAGQRKDSDTAQLLIQLARTETLATEYDEALKHALEAVRICEKLNDLRGLVTTLRIVGGAYWWIEHFDQAAAALQRGLELAERVGSAEEIGACLMNLGLVAKGEGAFEQAIDYERQAIAELERAGHASGRAQGYANLADTLELAGHLDDAYESCQKALTLAREIGYPVGVADATYTLACIEKKRENFSEAGTIAEQAAALFLDLGSEQKARAMLDLAADAWEHAGEADRARTCSVRARGLATAGL